MSANTVRSDLADLLTPKLPADWKIIPNQTVPETLHTVTVVLKHYKLEKLPEAPQRHLSNSFTLTVASPLTTIAKAEDDLDDAVLELVTTIDTLSSVDWTDATKVLVNDSYIGWDISLTVITQPEKGA